MKSSVRVAVSEESQVGEARRCVQEVARRISTDETFAGKAAIVATEMARNVVRHGGGGELLIRELQDPRQSSLELMTVDRGAGIRNVAECLRDGFSTYGSAGTGMGSIRRLANRFEIHSLRSKGTVVWARLCQSGAASGSTAFEIGAVSVAQEREEVCGDAWEVLESNERLRVMVADGLGHGTFAEEAAREAVGVFRSHPRETLPGVLEAAHRALVKTRGAAAAVAEILPSERRAAGAGVGNVATRLVHPEGSKNLLSDNGTLGASVRRVLEFSQPWQPGTLLVMHSDGLSAQWNLDDYPGLAQRHPSVIAGVLYRDHRRSRDDATVVVARACSA